MKRHLSVFVVAAIALVIILVQHGQLYRANQNLHRMNQEVGFRRFREFAIDEAMAQFLTYQALTLKAERQHVQEKEQKILTHAQARQLAVRYSQFIDEQELATRGIGKMVTGILESKLVQLKGR